MAKGLDKDDGTYHIWSYGFDNEEMLHLTHGVMFVMHTGDDVDGEYGDEEFVKGEFRSDSEFENVDGGENVEG